MIGWLDHYLTCTYKLKQAIDEQEQEIERAVIGHGKYRVVLTVT